MRFLKYLIVIYQMKHMTSKTPLTYFDATPVSLDSVTYCKNILLLLSVFMEFIITNKGLLFRRTALNNQVVMENDFDDIKGN